jgi:Flp pilus assembly protein TadG
MPNSQGTACFRRAHREFDPSGQERRKHGTQQNRSIFVTVDKRRGAVALETALVYPVLLLVFLGLVVGGMGVFRYQQVACQAREAARYAAVHGGDWQKATDKNSPTQSEIFTNAVLPLLAGMSSDSVTIQIQWIDQSSGTAVDWDKASKSPHSITASGESVTNTVRVTINYQWSPDIIFGPIYMTSTCEVPMTF